MSGIKAKRIYTFENETFNGLRLNGNDALTPTYVSKLREFASQNNHVGGAFICDENGSLVYVTSDEYYPFVCSICDHQIVSPECTVCLEHDTYHQHLSHDKAVVVLTMLINDRIQKDYVVQLYLTLDHYVFLVSTDYLLVVLNQAVVWARQTLERFNVKRRYSVRFGSVIDLDALVFDTNTAGALIENLYPKTLSYPSDGARTVSEIRNIRRELGVDV